MKLTCPNCGKSNGAATECPACGVRLVGGESARRAREYDGYAVGRRVLKLAPAWLLLIVVGFALMLLFFSWMNRPGGESVDEAFRNEAMNQPRATPEVMHAVAVPLRPAATPAPTAEVQDEAGSYSVQVGAYAELSQANEQVSRLRAAGFEARVVESSSTKHFRFQVRSGLYATREEAAHLASDLRARGAASEAVIVEPAGK